MESNVSQFCQSRAYEKSQKEADGGKVASGYFHFSLFVDVIKEKIFAKSNYFDTNYLYFTSNCSMRFSKGK